MDLLAPWLDWRWRFPSGRYEHAEHVSLAVTGRNFPRQVRSEVKYLPVSIRLIPLWKWGAVYLR